jgi:hypothetical protein
VWRAVAWAITDAPVRAAIPRYDRDQVAAYLGMPREQTAFIRWEYELDYESAPFDVADHGFVPARSAIPTCPAPSDWERRHRDLAGVFPVQTLNTLHRIDAAISFDVASEMSLIGLTDRSFADLQDCLNGQDAPLLADLLGNVGVFAHLTVVRDRFLGHHTYFAVASKRDLSESLDVLAQHYGDQWARYRAEMPAQSSFQDFVAAMERLLAPAARPSDPPLPRP